MLMDFFLNGLEDAFATFFGEYNDAERLHRVLFDVLCCCIGDCQRSILNHRDLNVVWNFGIRRRQLFDFLVVDVSVGVIDKDRVLVQTI